MIPPASPIGALKACAGFSATLALPESPAFVDTDMNRRTLQNVLTCTLLLAAATAVAGPASPSPTAAAAMSFDCAVPALPSQREVGALTGQNNLTQVYATRARLMAEVKRACQRSGTTRVVVTPPSETRATRLAQQTPTR